MNFTKPSLCLASFLFLAGCGDAGGGGPGPGTGGSGQLGSGGGTSAGSGGQPSSGAGGSGTGGGDIVGFPTAAEMVASWSIGWNVGNSLDVPEGETAWGNPVVSQALLDAVKAAGFTAVRIPVTWALHMGPGPTFTIDPAFLERVDEVVGYARSAGLAAIINVHHDGADAYEGPEWITLNDAQGAITDENNAQVRARFVAVWQQIATHFRDYDGGLLFESMNEIHDGYGAPVSAYYDIINALNQAFVDTVRATGGNNAERCLVVPGYNTNIDYTLAGFVAPTDTAQDRLILSVHYYDPYTFTIEAQKSWGTGTTNPDNWGQEDYVVAQYDKLVDEYVNQGLPVIVGEYGASKNPSYEAHRRYYLEYVTKVTSERGIVPFYWDNGGTLNQADNFGLFSRADGTVVYPDILTAMIKAATQSYPLSEVPKP